MAAKGRTSLDKDHIRFANKLRLLVIAPKWLRSLAVALLVSGFLCLLFCAMFWPGLNRGLIVAWDSLRTYFPLRLLSWHIASTYRQFPFWSPVESLGAPLFADCQSGAISPFNVLFAFGHPGYMFNVVVILHFVLAGMGVFVFLRLWKCRVSASLFGAVAYMFSGFLITNKEILALTFGACYLPWFLVAIELLAFARSRYGVLLLGAVTVLQFVDGQPQIAIYSYCFVFAYILFRVVTTRGNRVMFALSALTGLAFGVLFLAFYLLPTYQLTSLSVRTDPTFVFSCLGQMAFHELPSLLFPYLEGPAWSPTSIYVAIGKHPNIFRTVVLYTGIAPLFLAVAGLGWTSGIQRKLVAFCVLTSLVCIAISLGMHLPLYRAVWSLLLPIRSFREPHRCLFILNFSVASAAGMSLHALARRSTRRLRVLAPAGLLFVVSALVLCCMGHSTVFTWFRDWPSWFSKLSLSIPNVYIPLLLMTGALLSIVVSAWKAPRAFVPWLFVALLIVDVALFAPWFAPATGLPFETLDKALSLRKRASGVPDRYLSRWGSTGYFPISRIARSDLPRLAFYPVFAQYTAFVLKDWAWFLKHHPNGTYRDLRLFNANHFLNNANVRFSDYRNKRFAESVSQPFGESSYQATGALPRAFLTTEAIRFKSRDAMKDALLNNDFAWPSERCVALWESDPALQTWPTFQPDATGNCSMFSYTPNRVDIEVDVTGPMILVLSDTWYPNWRAKIDGRKVDIARAHIVLRAIAVPAGRHRVCFYYHSDYFLAGLCISLCALGVFVVGWFGRARLIDYVRCASPSFTFAWPRKWQPDASRRTIFRVIGLTALSAPVVLTAVVIVVNRCGGKHDEYATPALTLVDAREGVAVIKPLETKHKAVRLEADRYYMFCLVAWSSNRDDKVSCLFDCFHAGWDRPECQISALLDMHPREYKHVFSTKEAHPDTNLRVMNTSHSDCIYVKNAKLVSVDAWDAFWYNIARTANVPFLIWLLLVTISIAFLAWNHNSSRTCLMSHE